MPAHPLHPDPEPPPGYVPTIAPRGDYTLTKLDLTDTASKEFSPKKNPLIHDYTH